MKIFYFGGQKSGKTSLAIKKSLELSKNKKPFYIATYQDNYNDIEMQTRVKNHQKQREDTFITLEEPFNLSSQIHNEQTYVIDCISMWILNNIDKNESFLLFEIKKLFDIEANIIFILNDVNSGIIPIDSMSRKFVDLSGIIGQTIAQLSDEVYQVNYGIQSRLK